MAFRGGQVKTLKALKSSLKKSSGGGGRITYIPKEGGIVVRFLTEPTDWVEWFEHFDESKKASGDASQACTGDGCSYCEDNVRSSKRYLTAAVDVNNGNNTIALSLPVTAAGQIVKKYEKYSTILDRDYEIIREGTGLDTEYDVTPEGASRMDLRKYTVPDLMGVLEAQYGGEDEEEADEEDEKPVARRVVKKAPPIKKALPRRRPTILDEDDEDEAPPRRVVRSAAAPAKSIAKKVVRKPLRRP